MTSREWRTILLVAATAIAVVYGLALIAARPA